MRKAVMGGLVAVMAITLVGCGRKTTRERLHYSKANYTAVKVEATRNAGVKGLPPMRWDHRENAARWTKASLAALEAHGKALPEMVPSDIDQYCPGYPKASHAERKAFWVGLLSALAKHESTWNSKAVGGGGQWFGLVQISPRTAKGYGCKAQSGRALKNGADNLSCAIRIMAHTVPRDGVVSEGWRGVAADWGPFHTAEKRYDMMAWTSAQPYCQK